MQRSLLPRVKHPARWAIGLVAIGLVGTAISVGLTRTTAPQQDLSSLAVPVTSKDLAVQIKANGVVQAVRKINLSPKDSGRIVQLYVDEGDRVQQGQLIARMDSDQAQAQVNQFRAALSKAKADLAQKLAGNRSEDIAKAEADVKKFKAQLVEAQSRLTLANERVRRRQIPVDQGAVSRDSLDETLTEQRNARDNLEQAKASLEAAEQEWTKQRSGYRTEEIAQARAEVAQAMAQLRVYETQLENTLVRAPFSGIVTRRFAQEGDFVTPTTSASTSDGATSTSIAELSKGLEIEAKVPEASIAKINSGQRVEIRSDTYPDQVFQGHVRLVAPRAVQESNVTSFRVKVTLQSGLNTLKSGMNVKLIFLGDSIRNAAVVPLAAIVTKKDGQTGVLIPSENNQAQFRPVTLGAASSDQVQVIEGVKPGDRILLTPPPGQIIPGVDTIGL